MDTSLTLSLVGDSFVTMRQSVYDEPSFKQMVALIRDAHAGFTNLEVTLHEYEGYPAAQSGGTYTRADPHIIEDLKWMGFDLYSTANNHSLDYSYQGLFSTIASLKEANVTYAGTGKNLAEATAPAYFATKAGRIALISATSTFADWARAGSQRRDMQGRPGVNPLRYDTEYIVTEDTIETLKEIAAKLDLPKRIQEEGSYRFLGRKFVKGEEPKIRTKPNKEDMERNLTAVNHAARQADYVVFSLHAHEGRGSNHVKPAQYIETFARSCIEEGAHVLVGHGHHALRGIEIYEGKPICYSLGNFIFQNETVLKMPADFYRDLDMDPYTGNPADAFDKRHEYYAKGQPGMPAEFKWFTTDEKYWVSVIAKVRFDGGELKTMELYPVTLGMDRPRSQRGRPMLASEEKAVEVLETLQKRSEPYGTEIEIEDSIGKITR
ncbi:MAG: CapA family protein [Candidatus Korarchaeota archaeon]|nr:CapA family protein [Candidatus Korarchaeota archaeon]NIU85304.1 CapA family protein [Candidatus Thorarchaeota archaeon]NIW15404.1 CapA family protein [Candidatus Thorarchaeota archaeon]NIW53348.1 CapA family protein [Candidatus Korarchaeota archaeon]